MKNIQTQFLEDSKNDLSFLGDYGELLQKIILALEAIVPNGTKLLLVINCLSYFQNVLPSNTTFNILSNRIDLLIFEKTKILNEYLKNETEEKKIIKFIKENMAPIIDRITSPKIKNAIKNKIIANLDQYLSKETREKLIDELI